MQLVLSMATFLGLVGVLASFFLFYLGEKVFLLNREVIQSFIFLKLAVAGHLTIFLSRTKGYFWTITPITHKGNRNTGVLGRTPPAIPIRSADVNKAHQLLVCI